MFQPESNAGLTAKLVSGLYTEAMLLADEARAYFDEFGREARNAMTPMARVSFSCESLKVTTRLMHVVAWLLAQRAIAAGRGGAVPPLSAAAPSEPASLAALPEDARILIAASIDLYARIQRLEAQLAAGEGTMPPPSPALALHRRLERAF
jgi:regulator of CtrA degradation